MTSAKKSNRPLPRCVCSAMRSSLGCTPHTISVMPRAIARSLASPVSSARVNVHSVTPFASLPPTSTRSWRSAIDGAEYVVISPSSRYTDPSLPTKHSQLSAVTILPATSVMPKDT